MEEKTGGSPGPKTGLKETIRLFFSRAPLLGWFFGALLAVALEQWVGYDLSDLLGLPKIPVLFGCVLALKKPAMLPGALGYVLAIYILPVTIVARLTAPWANRIAARLFDLPRWVCVMVYLLFFYAILHIWADISAYRELTLKLTLIAVLLTLSLNIINGYMGEFSCSHPGFMAIGAYVASTVSVYFFVDDKLFGTAVFSGVPGWLVFPVALFVGGVAASISALVVAIPSFKTRGDYLAIISLAFMFIVKSAIENLEVVGGSRGLGNQPDWANLFTVFAWTAAGIWVINNFVTSTMGKALNAVRDDEIAASAMTVNTRRVKIIAFLFSAFWAGVAGGLFAHVIRYVNPGTFGIQKLAEVLAMVYFGGLNSVYGSIVGALSLSVLGEVLRPLELFKWIIIPLALILVMIYRPRGLVAFKEFKVENLVRPRGKR